MSVQVIHGDCLDVMGLCLPDNSVDSIVTDPPYGLSFMGKHWDHGVPGADFWREALKVAKPGAYMLAFGGTRTYHRLACAIEDAGWELRDCLMWVYGSGFPKSHNGEWGGTALKPAWEPIILARKALIGTVEKNFAVHGVGGLNIDGCRVEGESTRRVNTAEMGYHGGNRLAAEYRTGSDTGRWPANLIHDGSAEVVEMFPAAAGQLADASTNAGARKTQNTYGAMRRGRGDEPSADDDNEGAVGFKMKPGARRLDSGSSARFFYCAKASKTDRNEGLEAFTPTTTDGRTKPADNAYQRGKTERANHHPTVKPTELMRYLCRLVTPEDGLVLDPFMGSGSTGKGAVREGFKFIGIEREAEYCEIAKARIAA